MQERYDLGGRWEILFDRDNQGLSREWNLGRWPEGAAQPIDVPSVWNTIEPRYTGPAFYRTGFTASHDWCGCSVRLRIGAANYLAQGWLNGTYVGQHEGGYTPFEFDLSDALRLGEENVLVFRVLALPQRGEIDGLSLDSVPCSKETWYYGHGGIWGRVELLIEPRVRCSDLFVEPDVDSERAWAHLEITNETLAEAQTKVEVCISDQAGAGIGSAGFEATLAPGRSLRDLWIPFGSVRLWSPADPHLYRCSVTVRARGHAEHVRETAFGMRTFSVREGEFLLNGEPIFLRGTLYQPNYPVSLLYPPDPSWPEREMEQIKQAGFNMLRAHVRPACPEYLEIADRIGMLVYEETSVAWLERTARFYEHAEREVREMILRDRNHPSIVIWGVFNENVLANVRAGFHCIDYARSLDPTRVVVDNSGGSLAIGQDFGWVDRAHVLTPGSDHPQVMQDIHAYLGAPVSQTVDDWLRTLGEYPCSVNIARERYYYDAPMRAYHEQFRDASDKIFVSELGYGGLCDLEKAAAGYEGREDLTDAKEILALEESLSQGMKKRGLDQVFGGPSGIAGAAQEIQVEGNRRQLNALLANPRISGYCHTEFNDVGWECHAGIVNIWREPKALWHALREINEPQHLISRLSRYAVCPGEGVELELTLLLEEPAAQAAEVAVEVCGSGGDQIWAQSCRVSGEGRLTELAPIRIQAPERTGEYRVTACLMIGRERVSVVEERLLVLPAVDLGTITGRYSLAYKDAVLQELLGDARIGLPDVDCWLVVPDPGRASTGEWERWLKWVEDGGSTLVGPLTPDHGSALSCFARHGQVLHIEPTIGDWMGRYHYIKSSEAFEGLPADCMAGQAYAEIIPQYSLGELSQAVWAGAFRNHLRLRGEPYGFLWYADVQAVPVGMGQVLFCQYRVWDSIGGEPVADRLFANIVTMEA